MKYDHEVVIKVLDLMQEAIWAGDYGPWEVHSPVQLGATAQRIKSIDLITDVVINRSASELTLVPKVYK